MSEMTPNSTAKLSRSGGRNPLFFIRIPFASHPRVFNDSAISVLHIARPIVESSGIVPRLWFIVYRLLTYLNIDVLCFCVFAFSFFLSPGTEAVSTNRIRDRAIHDCGVA